MVVRDSSGVRDTLLTSRTPSSEATYVQGMVHFVSFMEANQLDRTVLQHGEHTSQLVVISFCQWLRQRTVFDELLSPPRLRPITGLYINSLVTHVVQWVAVHDSTISRTLRSATCASLIKAYDKNDTIIRGPLDAYCAYPLPCEFVKLTLAELRRRFGFDPATLALYSAVIVCEFCFGNRVYEMIDKDQGENPEIAPESDRPYINHAAHCEDVLLRWTEEGQWLSLCEYDKFPPGNPMVAQLLLPHTKNHQKGTEPAAVWANSKGPNQPFCICATLRAFADIWHASFRKGGKLFARASDGVLRYYLSPLYTHYHFRPLTHPTLVMDTLPPEMWSRM